MQTRSQRDRLPAAAAARPSRQAAASFLRQRDAATPPSAHLELRPRWRTAGTCRAARLQLGEDDAREHVVAPGCRRPRPQRGAAAHRLALEPDRPPRHRDHRVRGPSCELDQAAVHVPTGEPRGERSCLSRCRDVEKLAPPVPTAARRASRWCPALARSAAAMWREGLRPSTSKRRVSSNRLRGSSPGSSGVMLPRVNRTSRRPVRSSTSMNDVGETLPGSISTGDTSTPKSFSPRGYRHRPHLRKSAQIAGLAPSRHRGQRGADPAPPAWMLNVAALR